MAALIPAGRLIATAISFILALIIVGCQSPPRHEAVPAELQEQATVAGMSHIRYWADRQSGELMQDALESTSKEREQLHRSGSSEPLAPAEFLAISGGGANGAFGAGLLAGWSARGTRPRFKAVTGISAGALTAPFAFLGSDYDNKLKQLYTSDILQAANSLTADNAGLSRMVRQLVDRPLLDAIAAEYEQGRLLLIGTTELDARRLVIWNLGKIAASHNPRALTLIQELLVASAAVPGAFPPILIDVEAGGRSFQEMHVDGGATSQVFVYPPSLNLDESSRQNGIVRERRSYVIRNARLDPEWAEVDRVSQRVTDRAISSLIQTQGLGDLYRIYLTAQRDQVDFNLASIPASFKTPLKAPFDPEYMLKLFQVGYDLGAKGYPWAKSPPGFAVSEVRAKRAR